MKTKINKIKKWGFDLIRKNFWGDYDVNEEFSCGYCGKEMYHRYIFCSQTCEDLAMADDFNSGVGMLV